MKKKLSGFGCATILKSFLLAIGCVLFAAAHGHAAAIGLEWNPNTEPDLAGYRVYYASFSLLDSSTEAARANPAVAIWEVNQSTTTTTVYLQGNTTYYFRATAFDTSRNESGFNIEISTGGVPREHQVSAFIKRADVNNDGRVDILDLSILAKEGEW